jgi:hypothetical protein
MVIEVYKQKNNLKFEVKKVLEKPGMQIPARMNLK